MTTATVMAVLVTAIVLIRSIVGLIERDGVVVSVRTLVHEPALVKFVWPWLVLAISIGASVRRPAINRYSAAPDAVITSVASRKERQSRR